MSFDKAIEHGKEHRKKWSFAKSVDKRVLLRNCVENDVSEYIYEKVKKQYELLGE